MVRKYAKDHDEVNSIMRRSNMYKQSPIEPTTTTVIKDPRPSNATQKKEARSEK